MYINDMKIIDSPNLKNVLEIAFINGILYRSDLDKNPNFEDWFNKNEEFIKLVL